MSSYSRRQLEDWVKQIDIDGKDVVDLGGEQLPVDKRASGTPSSCKILDLPKYDLNLPQELKARYDIAFMLEVSEYLYNPVVALNNIHRLLKDDGLFYSSWHFIYQIHKPEKTDYLRYTPDGAERILKETGFEVVQHDLRTFEAYDAGALFAVEGMRGYGDVNIQGSLIKAKKI